MSDVDAAMRDPFDGNGQGKDRVHHPGRMARGRRGGGERTKKHGAIVVVALERRVVGRPVGRGVPGPVRVNGPGTVVLGRMVIRMRVYERSAQGRGVNGQGERDGKCLPHDGPIVRERRPPGQAAGRSNCLNNP